eukprot:SM000295S11281  [mRNA]  locus=s295:52133:54794:- [translate_table: standard]
MAAAVVAAPSAAAVVTAPSAAAAVDPADFQCPICLSLVYKPVINACGHAFCFWCIHRAMNPIRESHCPLCRRVFGHFPAICELLHCAISQAFPQQYQARAEETRDDEIANNVFSPDLDAAAPDAGGCDPSQCAARTPATEGDPIDATCGCGGNEPVTPMGCSLNIAAFECGACSELLHEPVVLNCGHVNHSHVLNHFLAAICLRCADTQQSQPNWLCPLHGCMARQPEGMLGKCMTLEKVLMTSHPDAYSSRSGRSTTMATSAAASEDATMPQSSAREPAEARLHSEASSSDRGSGTSGLSYQDQDRRHCPEAESSAVPQVGGDQGMVTLVQRAWENIAAVARRRQAARSQQEQESLDTLLKETRAQNYIHTGVGCDACGAFPIVGRRFHCKDCPEAVGYDVCSDCQQGPLPAAGRFNQRHRLEHRMVESPQYSGPLHFLLVAHSADLTIQQLIRLYGNELTATLMDADVDVGGEDSFEDQQATATPY